MRNSFLRAVNTSLMGAGGFALGHVMGGHFRSAPDVWGLAVSASFVAFTIYMKTIE